MAKDVGTSGNAPVVIGGDLSQYDLELEKVEAGTVVHLEERGDTYIGRWVGKEWITPDPDEPDKYFLQVKFEDVAVNHETGEYEIRAINCGAELERFFKDKEVDREVWVLQLVKTVDTGQPTEMNSFRVFKARLKGEAKHEVAVS